MRDEYIVSSRAFGKSSRELKNLINDYLNFRGIDIVVTSFDYDDYIRLKADNEKLRKCVEVYADQDWWELDESSNDYICSAPVADCEQLFLESKNLFAGKLARQTLKEIGGSE